MNLPNSLPVFARLSTREMIIRVLAKDYPKTLTQLAKQVREEFACDVTFQGVRKAARSLIAAGVAVKSGKDYRLSKDWIWKLRDFAEELQERYFEDKRFERIDAVSSDVKIYTFNNLIDADRFINLLIVEWFKKAPAQIYAQHAGHAYFLIGNLEEEHRIDEIISKKKIRFFTLTGGSSRLDSCAGSFYENQGFQYSFGSGHINRYFGVYGDMVFQYETPSALTRRIDLIYSKTRGFEDFDAAALIRLLRMSFPIKIMVMKNQLIAEQLRGFILDRFKNA